MASHSFDGGNLSWRWVNHQRWETEQQLDGTPAFSATRARGSWRLRPGSSAEVIGGFRTIDEVWAYAARLLSAAA